jgi:CRISPR-associated protein Cas5d
MNQYEVALEVAGPAAMFARPDTGGTPTSYPAPTWSAAKGLFESIAFLADGAAWICPAKVEVCRRTDESGGFVHFQRYTTNYSGPLRKADLFSMGANMQFFATILSNVCYRLYGIVVSSEWKKENNPRHHLQDLFNRRLRRGECFRTPCLGWSEFTCSYWGPFRTGITERDNSLSLEIPSMLVNVWNKPIFGRYNPKFHQDRRIEEGVLKYEIPGDWLSIKCREVIADAE